MRSHLEIWQAFAEDTVDKKLGQVCGQESVVLPTTGRTLADNAPVLPSHIISDVDLAMHLLCVAEIAHTDGGVDLAEHFVELAYELFDRACSARSANCRH